MGGALGRALPRARDHRALRVAVPRCSVRAQAPGGAWRDQGRALRDRLQWRAIRLAGGCRAAARAAARATAWCARRAERLRPTEPDRRTVQRTTRACAANAARRLSGWLPRDDRASSAAQQLMGARGANKGVREAARG